MTSAPPARSGALAPLLVLALDGATFSVIEPMCRAGRLPNLAAWMAEGVHQPLPSTTPPVTFPAWTSFMTGQPPAMHGIFDFTQKVPGQYRLRFVNASDRARPTLFAKVSEAGGRVLVLGMPASFPPEKVDGLLVSGFDAPVSTGTHARSASDPALYLEIEERVGPWMRPDLDETARAEDFHERALSTLLSRIDRKTDFALEALRMLTERSGGRRPELMMVVFSESDTVGHHYWRDHDPDSPRHDPQASEERRGAIEAVYARLDAACGRLREAYGQDAPCVVLSDHGMGGAAAHVVHLNRFLAEQGLLVRKGGGAGTARDALARRARDLALRWLPASLAQQIFRRARRAAAELESAARFGGLDWSRTLAFSEEANTQPGVWINRAGRESKGCVAPEDYEATRGRVIDALRAWRLPGGEPVCARVLRREDVHRGPFSERAPDVVIELGLEAGYGLSLVPTPWLEGGPQGEGIPALRTLAPSELGGGRGRGMNGTHRQDGIWIATGAGIVDAPAPANLERVATSLARAMGLAFPGQENDPTAAGRQPERSEYTDEEDRMVAERLRALGYLD